MAKKRPERSTLSSEPSSAAEFALPELRVFVVKRTDQSVATVYAHSTDLSASGALVFIRYTLVEGRPISHFSRIFNISEWADLEEKRSYPIMVIH